MKKDRLLCQETVPEKRRSRQKRSPGKEAGHAEKQGGRNGIQRFEKAVSGAEERD